MKYFNFLIISLLVGTILSVPVKAQYTGDSWSSVKSSGSGTLSLAYVETPGFVYKDANGVLTGICVDIIDDFLDYVNKKYKVNLQTKFVGEGNSFSKMYNSVKNSRGGVVGLGNITIRPSRKLEVKFSPAFITNFAILVTQPHVPTLTDLSQINKAFKGLIAYTPKGTTNENRILDLKQRFYRDMTVQSTSSSPETLEKVLADKDGFAYLDLAFYLDAVQRRKPLKRHPAGDQSSEQFAFIMPRNSDWQPLFNEFFAADGGFTNTTEYKKILIKHLGDTGVKLIETNKKF